MLCSVCSSVQSKIAWSSQYSSLSYSLLKSEHTSPYSRTLPGLPPSSPSNPTYRLHTRVNQFQIILRPPPTSLHPPSSPGPSPVPPPVLTMGQTLWAVEAGGEWAVGWPRSRDVYVGVYCVTPTHWNSLLSLVTRSRSSGCP